MKKQSLQLLFALMCMAALSLAHDPRTTAKTFSHALKIEGAGNLDLTYKAMHFNEATYKRMQADETFRNRLNTGLWSNIGSAESGFDVVFGDQTLAKGKYTLGLSIDANEAFSVVFKSGDKTLQVPLKVTAGNPDAPFLTFSLSPTDKVDVFVLEGRCGKYRGTADLKVPYLGEHSHPVQEKK